MATSVARANPQTDFNIEVVPLVSGLVATAQITTDGTGVAVNWATSFRAKGGITPVLTGKFLRLLVINNSANADAVTVQMDTTGHYITIPGRAAREFPGFDTGIAITLKQGDTTAGVVTLEAYYEGTYTA